jgi:hypothetical protein
MYNKLGLVYEKNTSENFNFLDDLEVILLQSDIDFFDDKTVPAY